MNLNTANINSLWASILVDELIRQGVTYFCISPGSRSTPLTAAVASNPEATPFIHFDERGAAYHALGYARATGRPAALVCTSGTAVANYLPAVVEASMSALPMVLLTADRPPELHDTGANQTITQPGIYSHYVRHEVNMPCPDMSIKAEFVLTTIDNAVHRARRNPAGPVHINCMFREPLAPVETGEDFDDYIEPLASWRKSRSPFTTYNPTRLSAAARDIDAVADILKQTLKGVLVIGRLKTRAEADAALKLSHKLGWPTFPDIMSGLRLGVDEKQLIHCYDRLLASDSFLVKRRPAVCLHIGGPVISRRLEDYLHSDRPEHYIVVNNDPRRLDAAHRVTMRLESDIPTFCEQLNERLDDNTPDEWLEGFQKGAATVNRIVDDVLAEQTRLSEPIIARIISENIPATSRLFLASSLPIREMDVFASNAGERVDLSANRGASGIDGTIATALGYAVGANKPVTLFIGDLAFLHDLNSLAMVKKAPAAVTIVVVNNNGGNIFSFLPIAKHHDIFEQFFVTPHNLHFEHAASMFALDYTKVDTVEGFTDSYLKAVSGTKSSIIEVTVDRHHTSDTHRAVADAIRNHPGPW